jgi:hypothetical protein
MTEKTPLQRAAGAVHEARDALERIDGRLAEMRPKAEALDELRVKLDLARARRAQLLGDALLAGRTADTSSVDKEIGAAERALEKRQDEVTALTRALKTLEAQRQAAAALLSEREAEYQERRKEHESLSNRAVRLAKEFHEAVISAHSLVADMPAEGGFRERLIAAGPELLKSGEAQLSVKVLQDLVTSQADAELCEADVQAAIPPPPPQNPKFLGYVWSDGMVHAELESPDPNPVTHITCGKVNRGVNSPPGMPGVRRA